MFLSAEFFFVFKIIVLLPILSPFGPCRPWQLHHSPPFFPVAMPCLVLVVSIVFIFSSDGTAVQCDPSPQWTSPSHLCFDLSFQFVILHLLIGESRLLWGGFLKTAIKLR